MIPRANITAWRARAPWPDDAHVEQDLILSRALVEIFARQVVAEQVAFRGGTALHKLYLEPPGRYSEDIDLVQREAGPIGTLVDELRAVLDPWLGQPTWKAGHGRFTLLYRFETTFTPVVRARLKVEINTREHFAVHGFVPRRLDVTNPWFSGATEVTTYTLSELLAPSSARSTSARRVATSSTSRRDWITRTSPGKRSWPRSTATWHSVRHPSREPDSRRTWRQRWPTPRFETTFQRCCGPA